MVRLRSIFLPRTMRQALLWVVFVVVVPLLLVQAGIYWSWYDSRQHSEQEANLELAKAMGNTFEEFLRDVSRQEQSTGATLLEIKPSPQNVQQLLTDNTKEYPVVRSWSWASPEGVVLGTTEPGLLGQSIADRFYFREIVSGKDWTLSDLLIGRPSGDALFVIAQGIRDKSGTLQGVMLAAVAPSNLNALEMWVNPRDEGTFTIFDHQGNLIIGRPQVKGDVIPNWKSHDPLLDEALTTGQAITGQEVTPMDSRPRFVSRVPIHETNWVAGFARPVSVAMAAVREQLWIIVLVNLGVIALSVFGTAMISRLIVLPLDRLRDHAQNIGQGRLHHRTEVSSLREMEELAKGFNLMAQQLQDRQQQVDTAMENLVRSNKELELFAYVASHDLQEPLRVVTGYTQLISRRYKGKLDTSADEFMAFTTDAVQRMQQLINDLLTFSRVGSRGMQFEPVDMQDAMKDVLGNLGHAIADAGAKVTHDQLPIVHGDRSQLVQLLQNIIGNAIKFRSPDRASQVHVSAASDGDSWVFCVRDNGIGIEKEYWDRIFVIFQRLHTRDRYAGTGIGLAICKKIIERHGGRIWLESQPEQGSAFFFSIKT